MYKTRYKQITQKHWQNIAKNESYIDENVRRKAINSVMPILNEIIDNSLTNRQRQVLRLYFSNDIKTQKHIAILLGITQPTVNQHLKGRIRNGKRMGGAVRRIRKEIRRKIISSNTFSDDIATLKIFDDLLNQIISRRDANTSLVDIHS